ncbi:MAG: hypothetical protein ACYS26_00160 [Planctomycetota bacterium]|jgi:hypothetical protein
MASTVGIHFGARRLQLIQLDGSPKKPKFVRALEGLCPADEADEEARLAAGLKLALKQDKKGWPDDNVRISVPADLGVFRHLALPFAEKAKIEEVLKFEVESEIPQWDVDDLVCDFITTESTPVESKLLVTAVPKAALLPRLDAATRAGLEPLEAELDTTSLLHAAEFCGVIDEEKTQILVHLGEQSSAIVMVSGGVIRAMRSVHTELEEVASAAAEDAEEAPAEQPEGEGAEGDEEELASVGQAVPVPAERRAVTLGRIRRELMRTVAGVDSEFEVSGIYICGLELPDLFETDFGGVRAQRLDPLIDLGTDLDEAARLRLAPAFGCALGQMGGGSLKPRLRREELAYAGTFERLELSLGVLALLLLTLMASMYIITNKRNAIAERDVNTWKVALQNFTVGNGAADSEHYLKLPPDKIKNYTTGIQGQYKDEDGRTPREQLNNLNSLYGNEIKALKRQLGTASDVAQPASVLRSSVLVLMVMDELGTERIGRFAIRSFESTYRMDKRGGDDTVVVEMNLTFFAENDRQGAQHYEAFVAELKAQDWVEEVPA